MNYKNILAFDCASSACSVSAAINGEIKASILLNEGLTHSLTLLPSIEKVLKKAEITVDELSAIAVTAGPGSFTGLKIGVATAKGLAFKNNIPCIALSSMTVLAYSQKDYFLGNKEGIICTSLDARRNMLYNALFICKDGKITRKTPDRQISASDLKEELSKETLPILLTGDGAHIIEGLLKEANLTFSIVSEENRNINAIYEIDAIFKKEGIILTAKDLVPEYIRPSQAERELKEKISNK